MTLTNVAGALLMASPVVFIAVYAVRFRGWTFMLSVFGMAFAILGILVLGSHLLHMK